MADAAFYGLAGEIVAGIEAYSEADRHALLTQTLVAAGNYIGRGPHFAVEGDRHFTNLFVCIAGATSTGRKGTSWGQVQRMLGRADPVYVRENIKGGLASGEGLLYHVRDANEQTGDPGVLDKRLLVVETEFASALRVMAREGNTLSPRIRQGWDTGNLSTLTRGEPITATDAQISIIAQVTDDELRRRLGGEQIANGFANRFLYVASRRSKYLPNGGEPSADALEQFGARLAAVRAHYGGRPVRLHCDAAAQSLWERGYRELADGAPGLLGTVTSRGAAQVMRLAVVYAALDCSTVIRECHLVAARAVWMYCLHSAAYIFGQQLTDPAVERICAALDAAWPGGLSRTLISALFGRHKSTEEINKALSTIEAMGRAETLRAPTGGRSAELWVAKKANYANEVPSAVSREALISLSSHNSQSVEQGAARVSSESAVDVVPWTIV